MHNLLKIEFQKECTQSTNAWMDMQTEEYEDEYKENNKLKEGKYSNVLYCIFIIEYLQLYINLLYGNQHKNVTF